MKTFEIEIKWKTGGAHIQREDFNNVAEAMNFVGKWVEERGYTDDVRETVIRELSGKEV